MYKKIKSILLHYKFMVKNLLDEGLISNNDLEEEKKNLKIF